MFRTYFTSSFSGLPGTIVFRGYIDCSGDPNYPAAISGDMYVVSVAGKIGGASGVLVEIGDQITCITDNAGGTQIAVGNDFSIAQANITYVPENAALKDTANGYPGLTSFKINFLNFLGTFTSYFQNTNTASRLYSFQDRDGTIADNTDLALKVDANASITGATKTKITYDTKGLVTAGADATTADINDSLNRRYVTDANLTVINNTSGVNTGNETTQTIGNLINSANSKTTPVDADQLGLMDSATGNILTKLSWANVKATLKTYFDTLYSAIGSSFFIGTTSIANNRASGSQTLTGVSIDGNAATVTTNANLTGNVTSVGNATTIAAGVVTEAMQVLADNTTQNVSTTKHGYAPKAPNDSTKYLDGTGAWSVPASSTPIGAEIFFDDSNPDTPALPAQFVEANGQTISDASSPYNGKRIRNLNGATVSSVTVTSLDNTAKTVTVSTNDIQAFMIGDTVTFTGVTVANGVIKAVNYGTGVITIGDATTWTSGNYDTTTETITGATAITSVGLKRFARGNSANTGGGGVNTLQGHYHSIQHTTYSGVEDATPPLISIMLTAANVGANQEVLNPLTDGTNGTPRTGTDTQPDFFEGVWIKKIK